MKAETDERGAPPPTLDEEVRVRLSRGDKRGALELLCRRLGKDVYAFARSMLKDETRAEDVRQQVFVEAYRDIERFEWRSPIKTWILGITHNRCLDALKSWRRWLDRLAPSARAEDESYDDHTDSDLDQQVYKKTLLDCVSKLRPGVRVAVCLRYSVEDMTYGEVAAICHKKTGTMQARVARALPLLRRCLERKLRGKVTP